MNQLRFVGSHYQLVNGICLNLNPERNALLATMLVLSEFGADAVNFDEERSVLGGVPRHLDAVQESRIDLDVQESVRQRDVCERAISWRFCGGGEDAC